MAARQLGHEVERYAGGVRERFVFVPDEARQGIKKLRRVDHDLVRLCTDRTRHLTREPQLVVCLLGERNRERLQRATDLARHQGRDRTAVEPS